ncbi:unnamed protein product, partial [Prorocentrum cordatum]
MQSRCDVVEAAGLGFAFFILGYAFRSAVARISSHNFFDVIALLDTDLNGKIDKGELDYVAKLVINDRELSLPSLMRRINHQEQCLHCWEALACALLLLPLVLPALLYQPGSAPLPRACCSAACCASSRRSSARSARCSTRSRGGSRSRRSAAGTLRRGGRRTPAAARPRRTTSTAPRSSRGSRRHRGHPAQGGRRRAASRGLRGGQAVLWRRGPQCPTRPLLMGRGRLRAAPRRPVPSLPPARASNGPAA